MVKTYKKNIRKNTNKNIRKNTNKNIRKNTNKNKRKKTRKNKRKTKNIRKTNKKTKKINGGKGCKNSIGFTQHTGECWNDTLMTVLCFDDDIGANIQPFFTKVTEIRERNKKSAQEVIRELIEKYDTPAHHEKFKYVLPLNISHADYPYFKQQSINYIVNMYDRFQNLDLDTVRTPEDYKTVAPAIFSRQYSYDTSIACVNSIRNIANINAKVEKKEGSGGGDLSSDTTVLSIMNYFLMNMVISADGVTTAEADPPTFLDLNDVFIRNKSIHYKINPMNNDKYEMANYDAAKAFAEINHLFEKYNNVMLGYAPGILITPEIRKSFNDFFDKGKQLEKEIQKDKLNKLENLDYDENDEKNNEQERQSKLLEIKKEKIDMFLKIKKDDFIVTAHAIAFLKCDDKEYYYNDNNAPPLTSYNWKQLLKETIATIIHKEEGDDINLPKIQKEDVINELNNTLLNATYMNCTAIGIENYDTFFPSNFDNVIHFYLQAFNNAVIAENLTKRLQYLNTKMPALDSASPYIDNWAKIVRLIFFLSSKDAITDEIRDKLVEDNATIFDESTPLAIYYEKNYTNPE
jgi:hypothetical protein